MKPYLLLQIEMLPWPADWNPDDHGEAYTRLWPDPILEAVREGLLPADPAVAARVLCRFLTHDEEILQRVDGSYGCISTRVGPGNRHYQPFSHNDRKDRNSCLYQIS